MALGAAAHIGVDPLQSEGNEWAYVVGGEAKGRTRLRCGEPAAEDPSPSVAMVCMVLELVIYEMARLCHAKGRDCWVPAAGGEEIG